MPSTVIPIDRAVPAMIRAAFSTSKAFKSLIFSLAISLHWAMVTLPILFLFGSPLPFSALTASFSSSAAGRALQFDVERAVLVNRDNDADHLPLRWADMALNFWMNWPGLTPCGAQSRADGRQRA